MNADGPVIVDDGGVRASGLRRFHEAQEGAWLRALTEIRQGAKRSHWMWFIFPQLAGLGQSPMSQFYAIRDLREAREYLQDEILAERLGDCTDAVLAWAGERSIGALFGAVDAVKFASSMTLFEAANGGRRYARALDAFFGGRRDTRTLELLR
ncbi:MAG: DUF1810 domain-containing protein [Sphingomonadales bacterium]|nr:DUF1810 domain-containing protein [Sphingomonadales bacterium]